MINSNEEYITSFKESKNTQLESINQIINTKHEKYLICQKHINEMNIQIKNYLNSISSLESEKNEMEIYKNKGLEYFENEVLKAQEAVMKYVSETTHRFLE